MSPTCWPPSGAWPTPPRKSRPCGGGAPRGGGGAGGGAGFLAAPRVATRVAAEAEDATLFSVATEEVGRLLGAQTSNMVRFTEGLEARVLGAWNEPGVHSVA